jgi:Zn-dependent protease
MRLALRAAIEASIATAVCAVAAYLVMTINVFVVIAIMLPLWWLDEMGIRGLGHAENGFFAPTQFGYVVGAALAWLAWFTVSLIVKLTRQDDEGSQSHG